MRDRSGTRLLIGALLTSAVTGCGGAKTGLDVPDASLDASTDAGVPCVELLLDGGPVDLPLETEAEVERADVVFLIDVTASMVQEIDAIRSELRDRIAPAARSEIADTQFAVATFGDFPQRPFGDPEDRPFSLALPMTSDLARVQAAVNAIELGNGVDEPESQVEALYQVLTGEGLPPFIPPGFGCPGGGSGYVCFRSDAFPIVLLFTDASMHNGPTGGNPYEDLVPPPHTYPELLAEIRRTGVHVIGLYSGPSGETRDDLEALVRDTRTFDARGRPLVFDIGTGAERLGTGVVEAIKTFAGTVEFDVDAFAVDGDPSDGIDAAALVDAIVPVRGTPADGVTSIDLDANVFRGVRAGTKLLFQLRTRPGAVVPGPSARRVRVEVVFRADGRSVLDRRIVELLIPGADGATCDTTQ